MPKLTEPELTELAVRLGCPENMAQQLTQKVVEFQTGGHPQLAHARLLTLSRTGWPAPTGEELVSIPVEVAQIRSEARQLMRDMAASEIEMLYRLSLIGGIFVVTKPSLSAGLDRRSLSREIASTVC